MLLLAAKALLTPTLLAACTIASRRWGAAVGGWLLGLPLASGPISLFLMLQHGSAFAESAARASLLGFLAVVAFCLTYLALAEQRSWPVALAGASATCLGTALACAFVELPLAVTVLGVLLAVALAAVVVGRREGVNAVASASVHGVVLRMATASALVVAITSASGVLGGVVSGLLAPLPVVAALMAAASHRRAGAPGARGLLSGVVRGLVGGVAFFGVVAGLIGLVPVWVVYCSAALAAAVAGVLASQLETVWRGYRSRSTFSTPRSAARSIASTAESRG